MLRHFLSDTRYPIYQRPQDLGEKEGGQRTTLSEADGSGAPLASGRGREEEIDEEGAGASAALTGVNEGVISQPQGLTRPAPALHTVVSCMYALIVM